MALDWLPTYPDLSPRQQVTFQNVPIATSASAFPFQALSWAARYPDRAQAARGYAQVARLTSESYRAYVSVPPRFYITQHVIEAWMPTDETIFTAAPDEVGLVWLELTFRAD